MAWAVIYSESSDARNKAIPEMSSGLPTLTNGTSFFAYLSKKGAFISLTTLIKEGNYGKNFLLTLRIRILSFTILIKMRIPCGCRRC